MTDRGARLLETTTRQITELSDLLSTSGDGILALPCPGRVRLGDGTVGAIASHTADSYRRTASFLQATVEGRSSSETAPHDMNHPTPNVDLKVCSSTSVTRSTR
jgi:hypothetical protein